MGNEKRLAIGLLILFLFVSMASATTNTIVVKTLPFHEVKITPFNSDKIGFESYAYLKNNSNQYGDASVLFDSSVTKFGIFVTVNKDGEKVYSEKLSDTFVAGEEIHVRVAPSWFEFIETPEPEPIINETEEIVEETTNLTEIKQESSTPLAGQAVSGENKVLTSKILYYIIGGVIVLVILFFVIRFFLKRSIKPHQEIKIRKLSELKQEQVSSAQEDEELKAAEEELKRAQEKISNLKNKDKIESLKKEIQEKEEELIRLRSSN